MTVVIHSFDLFVLLILPFGQRLFVLNIPRISLNFVILLFVVGNTFFFTSVYLTLFIKFFYAAKLSSTYGANIKFQEVSFVEAMCDIVLFLSLIISPNVTYLGLICVHFPKDLIIGLEVIHFVDLEMIVFLFSRIQFFFSFSHGVVGLSTKQLQYQF